MFHEGDLQSGIALAIQQSKSVACFVRDNGSDSSAWESEWLQGSETSKLLQTKSVILRIQAGSQEAGFLSAFCPVNEVPALAIIHNGQLLDLIANGVTKEEFGQRIQKALGAESTPSAGVSSSPANTASPPETQQAPPAPTVEDETPSSAAPVATAQALRQEREARTAVSKGKQKESTAPPDPTPASTTSQNPAARNEWLEQQRKRKSEARQERERVMAQIEADKAERRAKREQERLAREQAASTEVESPVASSPRRAFSNATTSNLQVRLLDGGTIRKQFPAEASLEKDVRPWIDSNLETKAPYTFKQILAPQPARAISISEEHASLRDLDLLPSATLVLQPIQAYSDAYESQKPSLMSLPYNAVTGAYGLVSGTLSGAANWLRGASFFRPEDDDGGRTLADAPQQESARAQQRDAQSTGDRPAPSNPRSNIRVRTLADQRDGSTDQQFYNGNSLDFEPNADESSSKR